MLQLANQTPFAATIAMLPNRNAVDTLFVVVRATFAIRPRLALVEKPVPPVAADEYWGDPATSSLKYSSDLHIGKTATDVVLMGQAWAPRAAQVSDTMVSVAVAERRKLARIFGDRTWRAANRFSAPQPFVSMPLVYERAYGGRHTAASAVVSAEERNPVGVGHLGRRRREELIGTKLPNIEDPARPMQEIGDAPTPTGFGFVAPAWSPRRAYAGTYDDEWKRRRAPYLPRDFDQRFLSSATPELIFNRFLAGGEPVELLGLSEQGPLRFTLPECRPRAEIKIAGIVERPAFNLETVLIEPDDNRIALVWRAALPCDRKVLKVEQVRLAGEGLDRQVVATP